MPITGQLATTLAIGMPGPVELIIILAIGLLIFGRRLPEVGRSLGKSIVEFKRGVRDIQNEIDEETEKPAPRDPDRIEAQRNVEAQGSRIVEDDADAEAQRVQREGGESPPASA